MTTAILSLLAYLIPFILDAWKAGSPQRAQEKTNATIQQNRQDIASGNSGSVSVRIDSVQSVQADAPASDPSGVGNDSPGERDARTLARLAALGFLGGETSGSGGEMPK